MIAGCGSWEAFRELADSQTVEKDKGDLFERLTQIYLETSPIYRSKLKKVWWCNKDAIPEHIRQKLNLPAGDEGIDLLCETHEGEFWSVQCKYRSDSNRRLNTQELSKFLSLSFVTCNLPFGLVVHTSNRPVKKSELMGNTTEIGLQSWLGITDRQWAQIVEVCKTNTLAPPLKRDPRDYQREAIENAKEYFRDKKTSRGKLIMPCGTGKSLIAYWITRALKVNTVIVAVPSLALVKQSLEDWTSEYLAEGIVPNWIVVCSDDSVGKMREADSTIATVYESGIRTTTDPAEIAGFIKKRTRGPKIVFTTYQSSRKLAEVCKQAGASIDLLIADEAHKTVGRKDKAFATLLSDENIEIKKRLFMTATERVYKQGSDDIVSMDDVGVYGEIFHQMSFRRAIEEETICDYKILTVSIAEAEIRDLVSDRSGVIAQSGNERLETDAHNLAAGIAVEKVFRKHNVKHAVSFHRSIARAKDFAHQQSVFGNRLSQSSRITNRHISSKLTAGKRAELLHDFEQDDRSLITNARCLTEGVDIPAIDCVVFVDPKQSVVDIVQAAGRAMRQSRETGKTHGYILLPIIVPEGSTLEEHAESTDFKAIARVITALSTQDERIAEELRSKQQTKKAKPSDIVQIDPDIIEALDVDYDDFYESILTKTWQFVGRANRRSFEEAREFARSRRLQNTLEWVKFTKSQNFPDDIPATPSRVYKDDGWAGFGDWLGTGAKSTRNRQYRSFQKARKFVRSQGLNSVKEWLVFTRSRDFPEDMPTKPSKVYKNKGWAGFGDWLGTGTIAPRLRKYKSFKEARKLVRSLELQSQKEWREFSKSPNRPDNIPAAPDRIYRDKGWAGFGDWLGTGTIAPRLRKYKSFQEARELVRSLKLKTQSEWDKYAKSGDLPEDIPANPKRVYKDKGWKGVGDWLGTGAIAPQSRRYKPFEEARAFARSLGLKTRSEWNEFTKSGGLPEDMPATPDKTYRGKGWKGVGDWLGTGAVAPYLREYKSFESAREFARSKGLRSGAEWQEFAKSGKLPQDIPAYPNQVYKDKGWRGVGDWLGTGVVAPRLRVYRSFEEARKFARSQGLKTRSQWQEFTSSGSFPSDIPLAPQHVFKGRGWRGYGDWLGTEPED